MDSEIHSKPSDPKNPSNGKRWPNIFKRKRHDPIDKTTPIQTPPNLVDLNNQGIGRRDFLKLLVPGAFVVRRAVLDGDESTLKTLDKLANSVSSTSTEVEFENNSKINIYDYLLGTDNPEYGTREQPFQIDYEKLTKDGIYEDGIGFVNNSQEMYALRFDHRLSGKHIRVNSIVCNVPFANQDPETYSQPSVHGQAKVGLNFKGNWQLHGMGTVEHPEFAPIISCTDGAESADIGILFDGRNTPNQIAQSEIFGIRVVGVSPEIRTRDNSLDVPAPAGIMAINTNLHSVNCSLICSDLPPEHASAHGGDSQLMRGFSLINTHALSENITYRSFIENPVVQYGLWDAITVTGEIEMEIVNPQLEQNERMFHSRGAAISTPHCHQNLTVRRDQDKSTQIRYSKGIFPPYSVQPHIEYSLNGRTNSSPLLKLENLEIECQRWVYGYEGSTTEINGGSVKIKPGSSTLFDEDQWNENTRVDPVISASLITQVSDLRIEIDPDVSSNCLQIISFTAPLEVLFNDMKGSLRDCFLDDDGSCQIEKLVIIDQGKNKLRNFAHPVIYFIMQGIPDDVQMISPFFSIIYDRDQSRFGLVCELSSNPGKESIVWERVGY